MHYNKIQDNNATFTSDSQGSQLSNVYITNPAMFLPDSIDHIV